MRSTRKRRPTKSTKNKLKTWSVCCVLFGGYRMQAPLKRLRCMIDVRDHGNTRGLSVWCRALCGSLKSSMLCPHTRQRRTSIFVQMGASWIKTKAPRKQYSVILSSLDDNRQCKDGNRVTISTHGPSAQLRPQFPYLFRFVFVFVFRF